MVPSDYDNDELIFQDEDAPGEGDEEHYRVWNILIVDDDEEIHTVTRLALSDLIVSDRKLNFLHAYTGAQALEVLEEHKRDIAIILLDVVMETDDAGLNVVKHMREQMHLLEPRIILRTGQPGYAPEEQVIKTYDINDYKTKTELTRGKLMTAVIASIRSYQQLRTINQSRIGLQKIIQSAANLLEEHSVKGYCEGIVTQITSLIGLEAEGVVCARAGSVLDKEDDEGVYILGAAGEFASYINERVEQIHNPVIVEHINRCLKFQKHVFEHSFSVLYINSSGFEAAVYVNMRHELSELDRQLLEIFLSSVSVGYENVNLFHQLRNAAFRDWLTRLPNRNEFINMLDRPHQIESTSGVTMALVDINHFSDINDGLGQEAGNEVLSAVSNRLLEAFGPDVKKGRIGADVFGLIGEQSIVNPEKINAVFESSFIAGDHTLPINVTIGLTRLTGERNKGTIILKQSNIALNRAKKNLTDNYEFFAPEIEEKTTWRLSMIRRLRTDFADRKLQLWFQPQVDLISEKVVGMEGLLRWPDSDGSYISPAVFVPLAEYSGLIVDIGQWVLEESCARIRQLKDAGYGHLRVAVNISIPQFRDRFFVDKVKGAIEKNGIDPTLLELEITESVVMDEPQIVIDALRALKEYGVAIAIDDFGTGFSSMSYLQQLPLDRLKVDRSFVSDIQPGSNAFIAETIVTLGNKLGLSTIAEGVEKREQASYMLKLGCDEAQGYLFARPMPFDQLMIFLDDANS
ncbi:bifunctional diguanylate cyclase/phosphodiesterase [Alteromonas oceanisediminis]|uniref:bifunctional diguanylate cyclase/phosphodiesterase n=1 Tax=Alteromonas oceanisediminis TaxID=2836180 RepID=UPI001BD91F83|nr:EAL domain-containing protein [Alteromonas oceanisediminis]MBT0585853.1 EAL domain-containing protein [Alteromonas oceanisediminis]